MIIDRANKNKNGGRLMTANARGWGVGKREKFSCALPSHLCTRFTCLLGWSSRKSKMSVDRLPCTGQQRVCTTQSKERTVLLNSIHLNGDTKVSLTNSKSTFACDHCIYLNVYFQEGETFPVIHLHISKSSKFLQYNDELEYEELMGFIAARTR